MASRPALRWLVPVAVLVVVLGAGAAVSALGARSAGDLAPRSAAQILADIRDARFDPVSGTVVEHAELGLPPLPSGVGGDGSSDFSSLVAGAHTMRVWSAGPQHARIALIGALGESDIVHNGPDVWIWSSTDNTATHATMPTALPSAPSGLSSPFPSGLPGGLGTAAPLTPLDAANDIISALSPTTSITSGGSVTVAHRSAYELVISPKDPAALIGSVRIAMDASRHIPLRVTIYATGSTKAAFEIGFTKVSFARSDPGVFQFNPPPGVIVKQAGGGAAPRPTATGPTATPNVIGSGWTAILSAPIPAGITASSGPHNGRHSDSTLGALLARLPTVKGAFGSGKLMQTALFSVLITDGGRIYLGAVDGAHLTAAASTAGR